MSDKETEKMMNGGAMGAVLRGMMGTKFEALLHHMIYEIDDIDGNTVWGGNNMPSWYAEMKTTRANIVKQLGDDGMERYKKFYAKREKEIYGK
jgi:hypothetical protein